MDKEFGTVILRKNARSRAISIRVRGTEDRNGSRVSVTVPWGLRYQDGLDYLEKRRGWIREAMERQTRHAKAAASEGKSVGEFADGMGVKTLLSHIVFRKREAPAASSRIGIRIARVENPEESRRLWLSLEKPLNIKILEFSSAGNCEKAKLKDALVKVLRDEAKLLLPQKAGLFAGMYGFRYRNITIKHNSSNWGSCSRAGNINLNLNLVRLPEPLCDYVILHELCHLKEPNHGSRFHTLLEALCLCNIRHLLSLGSPDAEKYIPWLDAAAAVKSDLSRTFKRAAYKAGMLDINTRNNSQRPSTSPSPLTPLDEVLSRETAKWRLI